MIAPERSGGIHTRVGILLRNNLLVAVVIFAALEWWRPYFFLTDDNLDGTFPFFVEMGQNLLAGRSPFISHHLFGGHYNFLRDSAAFAWHPLYLLVSLLAGTPFRNAIVDVDAFVMMMLAAAGFTVLAHYLRRQYELALGDGWIMFFTLSYTFSMTALTTGASWLTFLGDYSALPWLTLGVLQRDWRWGVGIVALFVLHQTLGGHLEPALSNSMFLTLFAGGVAYTRKSRVPLLNWFGGYLIALVIVSPLLVPMLNGFTATIRSQGVTMHDMQANNIPVDLFPLSLLFGTGLWLMQPLIHPNVTYTLALGSSAAVWCLLPALCGRGKWRGLQVVTLAVAACIAVLVCRPVWISEIMLDLPLFKAMRWPFRELIQLQFFLHLFLLVRPMGLPRLRVPAAIFSGFVFLVPLLLYRLPPTFNPMNWDRELIFTGGMDQYWAKVRPLLKPTDRIAVIIPLDIYEGDRFEEPYTLLGTYNYAELAGVVNAWGYSPTVPRDQAYTRIYAFYPFGAYSPGQKSYLMKEKPDLKFITLESLRPLKITLSSRDGPTIDLTPFVPKRISKDPGPPAPGGG